MKRLGSAEQPRIPIHIGGVFASATPAIVTTTLGSCIAVCLRDPITRIGGMNHFMLPEPTGESEWNGKYGLHAMDRLIEQCVALGAVRERLVAKVFGGGHVLRGAVTRDSIPQSNILFAQRFLQLEGIPIVAEDTGGFAGRSIGFHTDSGRVLLRRLEETGSNESQIEEIIKEEEDAYLQPKRRLAS